MKKQDLVIPAFFLILPLTTCYQRLRFYRNVPTGGNWEKLPDQYQQRISINPISQYPYQDIGKTDILTSK